MVATGNWQAWAYDRDAGELFECAKGDMYLHDMARTKGHIACLTAVKFHPKVRESYVLS